MVLSGIWATLAHVTYFFNAVENVFYDSVVNLFTIKLSASILQTSSLYLRISPVSTGISSARLRFIAECTIRCMGCDGLHVL